MFLKKFGFFILILIVMSIGASMGGDLLPRLAKLVNCYPNPRLGGIIGAIVAFALLAFGLHVVSKDPDAYNISGLLGVLSGLVLLFVF